ncbi:hypothetical protein [Bradyrhizobium sp. USDA 4452]
MEQLKLLMQYTIFHIGIYMSLSTGLVALLGLFPGHAGAMKTQLLITLGCFVVAGALGGMIAAHIPYSEDLDKFSKSNIGFFGMTFIPAWLAMALEHIVFWAGVGIALFGLSKVIWLPT